MSQELPKLYRDDSADLSIIRSLRIGVIGYGNQGRAQTMNLRDSGCDVVLGLRSGGPSEKQAGLDRFSVLSIPDMVKSTSVIVVLLPDQEMAEVYSTWVKPYLSEGQTLIFAHGYNVHYEHIELPQDVDVILVAPAGAGRLVRSEFKAGKGIPTLIGIHQDFSQQALKTALSYSKAIGGTRTGAFLSSFKEETESDLFGEQAVLTGGIPQLIKAAYKTLVDRGFQPIVAWFVCYYEVKMIVDLFHDRGFEYLSEAISDTAEYGGYTRGKRVIGETVNENLNSILDEIQSGVFDKEWKQENASGQMLLKKLRESENSEKINKISDLLLDLLHDDEGKQK